MTTRRGFLGLLAAAPIAAPAMAKAAVETVQEAYISASMPRYGFGLSAMDASWSEAIIRAPKLDVASLKISVDSSALEDAMKRLNAVTTEPLKPEVAAMLKMSNHPDVLLRDGQVDEAWLADLDRTLFGDLPLTVPNRLYGATINEHGEAV